MSRDASYWSARTIKEPWEQRRADAKASLEYTQKQLELDKLITKENQAYGEKISQVYQSIANLEMGAKDKQVLLEKFKNDIQLETQKGIRKSGGDARVWLQGGGEMWLNQQGGQIPMWEEFERGQMNALAEKQYQDAKVRGDFIKPVLLPNGEYVSFEEARDAYRDLDDMDATSLPYAGSVSKSSFMSMLSYFGDQPKPGYEGTFNRQPITQKDIAEFLISVERLDQGQAEMLSEMMYNSGRAIGGVNFRWGAGGEIKDGNNNLGNNTSKSQKFNYYSTTFTGGAKGGHFFPSPTEDGGVAAIPLTRTIEDLYNGNITREDYENDYWPTGHRTLYNNIGDKYAPILLNNQVALPSIETYPINSYSDAIYMIEEFTSPRPLDNESKPQGYNFYLRPSNMTSSDGSGSPLDILVQSADSDGNIALTSIPSNVFTDGMLEFAYNLGEDYLDKYKISDVKRRYNNKGLGDVNSYVSKMYDLSIPVTGENDTYFRRIPQEGESYMSTRVRIQEEHFNKLPAAIQTTLKKSLKFVDVLGTNNTYVGEILIPVEFSGEKALGSGEKGATTDPGKHPSAMNSRSATTIYDVNQGYMGIDINNFIIKDENTEEKVIEEKKKKGFNFNKTNNYGEN